METPLFPSLQPKIADPHWFCVDRPCDDEAELTQLEKEHQNALTSISQKHSELVPIGKTAAELQEEDEEDEEEDDNDDEESDSNEDEDDELDADDMNYDQDSPMFH
ncbi:anaphase-promoting complex subunit 15B-like isoform X1 [Ornithodoros turicata]|uniref:anaphase-promoting complex subunit 15B-like isoform X1 n=1 Tax=Ornithodoros turicata TaxID=34597 RepID=UPI003139B1CF